MQLRCAGPGAKHPSMDSERSSLLSDEEGILGLKSRKKDFIVALNVPKCSE